MNVALMFLAHNRLDYTQKALNSVLQDSADEFDLYIWDNNSTDGTADYLKSVKDPRIKEVCLNKDNLGQAPAMNTVWLKTKAELVGKLDNDCIMPPGWFKPIKQAHEEIPKMGAIACWHFRPEDFDLAKAEHKIHQFGGHKILRHPWICGTGFLIKRNTFLQIGPWDVGKNVGTTYYWIKMAHAGFINGWYYPLIWQEHMDDPMSQYTYLKTDQAIKARYEVTYTLRNRNIDSLDKRMQWRAKVLENLLTDPWQVEHYTGWRKLLRKFTASF